MAETIPVCVYTANGQMEANVVKGMLESEGITVMLQYESLGIITGVTADGLGQVKVLVPQTMEAQALALLDEAIEEGPASEEDGEDEEEDEAGRDDGAVV